MTTCCVQYLHHAIPAHHCDILSRAFFTLCHFGMRHFGTVGKSLGPSPV